jgi:parallel beta-helix repeat protein
MLNLVECEVSDCSGDGVRVVEGHAEVTGCHVHSNGGNGLFVSGAAVATVAVAVGDSIQPGGSKYTPSELRAVGNRVNGNGDRGIVAVGSRVLVKGNTVHDNKSFAVELAADRRTGYGCLGSVCGNRLRSWLVDLGAVDPSMGLHVPTDAGGRAVKVEANDLLVLDEQEPFSGHAFVVD